MAVKLTVTVCVTIAALQIIYFLLPAETGHVMFFNRLLRPLVYGGLTALVYGLLDKPAPPSNNTTEANLSAVFSVLMYGAFFIAASFLFGVGINAVQPGVFNMFLHHLWNTGVILILGELIRFKLIKASGNNIAVAGWLAAALAFGLLIQLRYIIRFDFMGLPDFIFIYLLGACALSITASIFAVKGTLFSVLLVSWVYFMVPLLAPVLPGLQAIPFALVNFTLLFISNFIVCHLCGEKNRLARLRVTRQERYIKTPPSTYALTGVAAVVLIAFFSGHFAIYPVVILTDSMAGELNRGSIAFVQRTPDVLTNAQGDVIHFNQGETAYIHRIVDYSHNDLGERVFITQGDASPDPDPFTVTQEDVSGVVIARLPLLGWPYMFLRALTGGGF